MSEQLNVNSCEMYGKIIVIKRTGEDSASFELVDDSYTFGRYAKKTSFNYMFLWNHLVRLNVTLEFNC